MPDVIFRKRRTGADAGLSLRKRRRWYAETGSESQNNQGQQDGGQGGQANGTFDLSKLPSEFQTEFKKLQDALKQANEESAGRRHEIKGLQKQLEERKAAEQTELAEQGKYKTLAEQRAAEIATLSAYKERAEQLEELFRESNARRIKLLPEDTLPMVNPLVEALTPEKFSKWFDVNFERLTKKPAPSTDAGAGSGGSGQALASKLTAEERSLAKQFDMTDEDYAKYKAARTPPATLESLKGQ